MLALSLVLILVVPTLNSPGLRALGQGSTQKSEQSFVSSFESIVNEAQLLTHDYDVQVEKWGRGEHNNATMASITDNYLPKYKDLIKKTEDLEPPTRYENVSKLYAKSLQSELNSHTHFRNYLVTGNTTENKASVQSLSDALRYEMDSFSAFKSASKTNTK
jgi:hypothetical protein